MEALSIPLIVDVDLSSTRSLPCCHRSSASSALVLDIFEAVNEVWNAGKANEAAEAQCPETDLHVSYFVVSANEACNTHCVQSPLMVCVFVNPR
jgi:hypothetical protein